MKIKPILYSTEMVQALLENRKSQTRRTKGLNYINTNPDNWEIEYLDSIWARAKDFEIKELKKPYDVGDILWVRESFTPVGYKEKPMYYLYKANRDHKSMKWKPSIHMPKKAARLFLKVTNIRVERLQDITEADAIAEGIYMNYPIVYRDYLQKDHSRTGFDNPIESFFSLWGFINGEASLKSNAWVWVIEFERVEKPENF